MSIHVQLERFEGPLGLLLHLIREQEMDIFNINIHEITRQYLEYIKTMRRLDLEVAGEFVAMAATLLHIKSRMLLPQYNEEGEEIQEDPRKELVQKLVEYKKIQELSGELYKRRLLGRDVFTRGEREQVEALEESELVLEENPLFSLIAAYRTAVKNMKKTVHKVAGELQSIASRIMEMKTFLLVGKRVVFRELITAKESIGSQVLVTFLSLLELAKMGFVNVFQTEPFADIYIETKQEIDNAAVSRAENYDSVNAVAKAEEIMNEAQLSLEEPVAELEGEEAPVVQESFADAASDADIEAEERRLFAEESGGMAEPVSEPVSLDSAEVTVEPAEANSEVTEAGAAVAEIASGPESSAPEIAASPSAPQVEEPAGFMETIPLPPETEAAVTDALPTMAEELPAVEQPAAEEAAADANTTAVPDFAFLTAPETPASPEEATPGTPALSPEDAAKEKLNSALSAALSAFNAFNDEPEVES